VESDVMIEITEILTALDVAAAEELLDLAAAESHTVRALPPEAREALGTEAAYALLARSGGRVIGLLFAVEREEGLALSALFVRPEWRRQDVARSLLAALMEMPGAEGRRLATAPVDSRDPASAVFFTSLGWRAERTGALQMRRDLDDLPPLQVPSGYRLRTYQEGDEEAWMRVIRAAFATEAGTHAPAGDSAFRRELAESPLFEPERVFFAVREADGEVAGTTSSWEAEIDGRLVGLIHWVAVAPEHRGHALGEALNLAALHDMRARGHREAYLNTHTALRSAVHLYESLGFRPAQHWVLYHRPESHASG
jgi:mycothiol synthase